MGTKPKLSVYWAASCGGCEITVANLHEKLLDVDAAFDFVFCPCLLDTKYSDVEAMPDDSIAVTLFNGAIRTDENLALARLLRRKSRLLIAFGACAYQGGVPGLSNVSSLADHVRTVFGQGPTLDNPAGVVPQLRVAVAEGELELPALHERVRTLADVVEVDYSIPGCPPEPHQVWAVLDAIGRGEPLPPPGSVLGATRSSVCDECPRARGDKKIKKLVRTWEIVPDPEQCLLEQGLLCVGVATRGGCGALCPQVQAPCIGCYGPPEGVVDQGAKMASALGSMIDIEPLKGLPDAEIVAGIDAVLDAVDDYVGCFYRFGLPGSALKASVAARTGTGAADGAGVADGAGSCGVSDDGQGNRP